MKRIAAQKGCTVIDLYQEHLPNDTIDGSHPSADGMNTLATLVIRGICEQKGLNFLDGNCEE